MRSPKGFYRFTATIGKDDLVSHDVHRFTATIGKEDLAPEVLGRGPSGPSVGSQALRRGAWGAGLGFIVAMGDVTINGSRGRTTGRVVEGVVVPTSVGLGAGAMGGAMDAAIVAPSLAKGMSAAATGAMYGVGAAVGAATLAVSSLWDVSKRARGHITGVEQRKGFSSGHKPLTRSAVPFMLPKSLKQLIIGFRAVGCLGPRGRVHTPVSE